MIYVSLVLLFLKIGRHITGHWWDSAQIFLLLLLFLFAAWSKVIYSWTSFLLIVLRVYITGCECFITISKSVLLLWAISASWEAAGGVFQFQLQRVSGPGLFRKAVAEIGYAPKATKNLKVTGPYEQTCQYSIDMLVITSPFFWSCSAPRSRVSEETARISLSRTPPASLCSLWVGWCSGFQQGSFRWGLTVSWHSSPLHFFVGQVPCLKVLPQPHPPHLPP